MTLVPVIWGVWGALIVLFFIVHLYQSRIARDENDEIFLGEGSANTRVAQAEIAAKVHKIEPIAKTIKWLIAASTLCVIGYYAFDIYNQFK